MKIAVILQQDVQEGGGYQQALNMLLLLNKKQHKDREFVFLTTLRYNVEVLSTYGIQAYFLKLTLLSKILLRATRHLLFHRLLKKIHIVNPLDKYLSQYDIDLFYFSFPQLPKCI